ncbi:MAG TPA: sulfatase [Daejeonella sp.]|nr:sulfatase [Daejeonella sp.]
MIRHTSNLENLASSKNTKNTEPAVRIFYTGLSLFLFLLAIRTRVVDIEWHSIRSLLTYLPKGFIAAFHDFQFVLVLTLVFGVFLYFFKEKRKYGKLIYHVYLVTALFAMIAGILNERTIRVIGNPFSYQWLYYSDFMGSKDSQNAMLANISWQLFAVMIASCGLLILMVHGFIILHNYFRGGNPGKLRLKPVLIALSFFIAYSFTFNWYKDVKNWQYNQLANPITFFIESIFQTDKGNFLFSMDVPDDFEDLNSNKAIIRTTSFSSDSSKVKNVIFFILESVPAEYLDSYGGSFNITPEINKLIPKAVRFENTYAHSPATNNAMVSILGSMYPWISYKSLTKEYPQIKVNSISTLLKQKKYRTAFYSAADIKFQRGDEFVRNQEFDTIEDFSSENCKGNQFIVKGKRWENPDGADDDCMVKSFSEWVDQDKQRPFFATLWTVQTHYPYFYSGKKKDYKVKEPLLNRYLNALHHSDQTLGKLMTALKERGLEESTLVVIVGDHGEAFGRHDQYTHASKIYEENVHVPLLFVNKNLFHGEVNNRVSGQVDIAPTVMNILGFPADEQWQGQSLFNEASNNRTYFFAPWSDFLFGFRENNLKFIYNATKNTTEVYDLDKDPTEQSNIVDQFSPDYVEKGHKRLAQWIQYQDKFIKASISK